MYSVPIQITVILSIAVSIILGSKLNKNPGLISIAFAYIIACFMMKKSSAEFASYWPIEVTMLQIGVGYFYGFALVNGTMDKLAEKLIYPFRKKAALIPFALFLFLHC